MPGEVSVSLHLILEQAKKQMKDFVRDNANILGTKGTAGDMGAVAAGTNKATTAQENLAKSVKKTTGALASQLAEWRKANPGGVTPGQKISFASDVKPGNQFAKWYPGQTVK